MLHPGQHSFSVQEMCLFSGDQEREGTVMRNRSEPGNMDREDCSHGRGLSERGRQQRGIRGMLMVGPCTGVAEAGGWWCAGAHVAARARAALPADSAEQAGTNSPRLMCLLPGINSHSSGWETGRAQPLPSPQA